MKEIKRGEVYYADVSPCVGSEQDGFRPVVIVQNNLGNKHSSTTIAVAITSRKPKSNIPTHIVIEPTDWLSGLNRMVQSIILTEQIQTIDKSRLGRYLCTLTEEQMEKVDQAQQAGREYDKDPYGWNLATIYKMFENET